MCATPRKGRRWCSHSAWNGMPRITIGPSYPSAGCRAVGGSGSAVVSAASATAARCGVARSRSLPGSNPSASSRSAIACSAFASSATASTLLDRAQFIPADDDPRAGPRNVERVIEATGLTKRYGVKTAVDDVSFTVRPGIVTGFLGPNGAGKSTTMRLIVGLDAPDAGTVRVNGQPYAQHRAPLREVGVLLEARAVHSG